MGGELVAPGDETRKPIQEESEMADEERNLTNIAHPGEETLQALGLLCLCTIDMCNARQVTLYS